MTDWTTIVVTDTSGSMREHGKAMLVRGLLTHVRQTAEEVTEGAPPGAPILVIWGSEAYVLTTAVDEDLPLLPVGGSAAVQPLLALLDSLPVESSRIGLLVLSDGHLPAADVNGFRAWLRRRPGVSVRAIAVGPGRHDRQPRPPDWRRGRAGAPRDRGGHDGRQRMVPAGGD